MVCKLGKSFGLEGKIIRCFGYRVILLKSDRKLVGSKLLTVALNFFPMGSPGSMAHKLASPVMAINFHVFHS